MTGMADRRRLMELARAGAAGRAVPAAQALTEVPVLTARILEEMCGEPVRAYLAVGAQEVAALEAFMRSRGLGGG